MNKYESHTGTALKLRHELETCPVEISTVTKQEEMELLNSIQDSVNNSQIVTRWNIFNRALRFSHSFSVQTLNRLCQKDFQNPLQMLEECCNVKSSVLPIVFRCFRNLMIWDDDRCDKLKAIEIVLKLSHLDTTTIETRNLISNFVQYLIRPEHVRMSILESCILCPSAKFRCVCKTFSSSRVESNDNIERLVLKDLISRCPTLARSSFKILCNTKKKTIEFSRLACLVAILEVSFARFTWEDLDSVVNSLFGILRHIFKTRRMFEHGESSCFSSFILNVLSFVRSRSSRTFLSGVLCQSLYLSHILLDCNKATQISILSNTGTCPESR